MKPIDTTKRVARNDECTECSSSNINQEDAEIVCQSCGAVLEERLIDHGPEWRMFEDTSGNPRRTGPSITATRHDRGLTTEIGSQTDGKGKALSERKRQKADRMRWIATREGEDKHDRTLKFAFGEINRVTGALELPDIIQRESCDLFREAKADDLLPGASIEAVVGAVVLLATKDHKMFRSYEQVADVSRVDVREIERQYLRLNQHLDLQIEPLVPMDILPQLVGRVVAAVDELEVRSRGTVETTARDLVAAGQADNYHVGKRPSAVAAGAIYAAARMQFDDSVVTQQAVAEVADVSAPTIRKHYTNLETAWEEHNTNANADTETDADTNTDATAECNETAAP